MEKKTFTKEALKNEQEILKDRDNKFNEIKEYIDKIKERKYHQKLKYSFYIYA